MGKKIFLAVVMIALACSAVYIGQTAVESTYDGQLVKMEGLDTLYYVADGKRYVFPNEKTYKSWFTGFEDVVTLTPEQIYALPLAGNIRYRPGVVMVKITTDPKVYAVTKNGVLRWVKTEALAKHLYGDNWNLLIDDIPDSFFTNYSTGDPIDDNSDYNVDTEVEDTDSINENQGLALGHIKQAQTTKCRAIPAIPATPGHKGQKATPATPAVPARECKIQNGGDTDDDTDTTAPLITGLTATTTTSTAAVSWTTNETATGLIKYALESLSTATTSAVTTLAAAATTTAHLFNLTGLTASSTYYYKVWSTDLSSNTASSAEATFLTLTQ